MIKFITCAISTLCIIALTLVAGIGTASADTTTYSSTDVPKATVDNGTVTSTISILPCDTSITDINVQINIDHDFLDDLDILLIGPDGTTIELTTDNGGAAGSYTDTIFDDEATTLITAGSSPFTGSYQPEGSLAAFDGQSRKGTWTLQVTDDDIFDDTGTLNSWSLTIETPDTPVTVPSSDIPKVIPDPGEATSTITSCNTTGMTITDVNVQLDITHTWDGDLDIFLIAPDGTRIKLSTNNGGDGDHYTGTIFDDEAETSITVGSAPFSYSYQPEEPLSALDGTTADGTWTLEVTDDYNNFVAGGLNSWSLTFELIDESYSVSTYVSDLPLSVAGLTADQSTRTLYYADMGIPFGTLRQITSDGTVSLVTNSFAPVPDYYSFTSTDIQFLNGNVYVPLGSGKLARIDPATGITTSDHTFTDFGNDSGIAIKNGQLLVTSGTGPATEIRLYDTNTGTAGLALNVSPLSEAYSVEYDRVNDATYFWSDGSFYTADLVAGTHAVIPSYTNFRDDFAVSPDGNYLITTRDSNIEFVSVVDGSSTTLYNALKVSARHDMALAQSSAGRGCSLYVVDGASILEISGFERCNPFPWAMFLPAISNKTQN